MKNVLYLSLITLLILPPPLSSQPQAEEPLGWLPPGNAWFEFTHRLLNTGHAPELLDRYYRGKFIYGLWKPIWRGERMSFELTMVPQFLYGGFHERRILLPAFSFRGELALRYRLNKNGFELTLANLHYSTHTVDRLPVSTPRDKLALQELKVVIDDINLLRLDATWRGELATPLTDLAWVEAGVQPWRMNYWLITELDRIGKRTSYEPYDRRLYFGFELAKRVGASRLTVRCSAEAERTLRSAIELRYSTLLNAIPSYDGLQLYLAYEGAHIASNEVTITPHNGISRDWLVAGIRVFTN